MKRFLFLLLILFFGLNLTAEASFATSEIEATPALITKTFDHKIFNLKQKRGKVVVVNFWASWCKQCREEMLVLDQLYQKYKNSGLEVIGISIDEGKERQNAKIIAADHSYPNSLISSAKTNDFNYPDSVPTTYIIGPKGNIFKTITLNSDIIVAEQDFEKILNQLLK